MECESHFEELVRNAEQAVACPSAAPANVLKQLSTFAVAGIVVAAQLRRRRRLLRRLLRQLLTVHRPATHPDERRARRVPGRDGRLHPLPSPQGGRRWCSARASGCRPERSSARPRVPRGQAGCAVRRPGRSAAQAAPERDRALADGRLHRECPEVQAFPGNRDPQPDEIEACESHLFRQIELIRPVRGHARQLRDEALSGKRLPGITRHGMPQQVTFGGNEVTLYPLPLPPGRRPYTRSMLAVLEQDFTRIPELLGLGLPSRPEAPPEPVPSRWSASPSRPSSRALLAARWSSARPRPARPRRSPRGSPAGSRRATSSPWRVSSGRARRRSSAVACRARRDRPGVTSPTTRSGTATRASPTSPTSTFFRFAGARPRSGRTSSRTSAMPRLRRVAGGGGSAACCPCVLPYASSTRGRRRAGSTTGGRNMVTMTRRDRIGWSPRSCCRSRLRRRERRLRGGGRERRQRRLRRGQGGAGLDGVRA